MHTPSPTERRRELATLARSQGGFFTARQAAALGYTGSKRNYHVRAGNWIREYRGIYRLALLPEPERSDLILWWLWSRDRSGKPGGVFSHRTALSLHDLTDLMPAKVDLTVPRGFRRGAPIPKVLRLHYANLAPSDVEVIHGVPVTRALRTLLDLWAEGRTPKSFLVEAFQQALRRGLITRAEVRRAGASPDWQTAVQALAEGGSH